jgi:hypothetical protein
VTWAKLSDSFGDEVAGLSDAAFRTHVEALLWAMRRETDGHLAERDVRRFAETADPAAAVQELLAHGLWAREQGGYVVLHHMEHQPEREVIAARRAAAAERQSRKRRKDAGLEVPASRRESRRDDPRDPGRDGPGTGQALSGNSDQQQPSWPPTAHIPGSGDQADHDQAELPVEDPPGWADEYELQQGTG